MPHPLRQGEKAYLLVTLGILSGIREVDVESEGGVFIGLASPFAIPPGKPAGTYIIPVPDAAIQENSLSLRFYIPKPDGSSRPATAGEVVKVTLEIGPNSR